MATKKNEKTTRKLESQFVKNEEAAKKKDKFDWDAEEKKHELYWMLRLRSSYDQMNTKLDEFDQESLITTMRQNRLLGNSFLTPIMNDGEVRVVTGTTEGKLDSVFNAIYNQNIQNDIRAFDEYDVKDLQLGDSLTKIVDRTNQIERDDDFYESLLREILIQPAVFVQETMSEEWYYDRQLSKGEWDDLWEFKIPEFKNVGYMCRREPKKVLWTAEQVFLGNIKIPMRLFQTQPYVITIRTRTMDEVRTVYQNSPRLKYVKGGMKQFEHYKNIVETSEWFLDKKLQNNEVIEIVCKDVPNDEMQIYLGFIPMLPVGCPLLTTRMKTYDMTMEGGKEIHPKFAYRRPMVSMAKVLQALKDENFRLLILEARQRIWKPIVTKAKVILNKDMWLPSAITYGIDKNQIDILTGDQPVGANSIEVMMNEMIDKEIEAFLNVSTVFQGLSDGKQRTAHEVAQMMKQALLGLGQTLTGYIRAKRNCTYLRLYNVLQNMTKPVDTRYNDHLGTSEDIYRTFTIDESSLWDGKIGTEIISFINRELLPEEKEQVIKIDKESRENGKPVSHTFLPVEKLLMTRYMFYVDGNITEKRSSMLESEMAKKDIADSVDFAKAIGVGVNAESATQEWGKQVRRIDPQKFFVIPQQNMGQPGIPGQPGAMPMPVPESAAPGTGPNLTTGMVKPGVKQLMVADSMKS